MVLRLGLVLFPSNNYRCRAGKGQGARGKGQGARGKGQGIIRRTDDLVNGLVLCGVSPDDELHVISGRS